MAKRVRLDYLDIAKAITIFLVIMGHATPNDVAPYYRLILYTFHMPLFFMVSGVTVRRHRHEYNKEHWLNFLRKNIVALVIPYFLWAIIYTSLDYTKILNLLYASWAKLDEIGTLTSLWFLPCLFSARILCELVMMISTYFEKINRHLFGFICSILAFGIGFTLPFIKQGYPWCLDSSFTALGFMLLGYSLKERIDQKDMKFLGFHFLVYIAIFVGAIVYAGEDLPYMRMFDNDINTPALFLVSSLSGCGIILSLSRMIAKGWENKDSKVKSFILWVGRSTIGIFLLHKPFLQEVVIPFLQNCGFDKESFVAALLGACIAFTYSVLMIKVIERYMPELFGKFHNNKTIVFKEEENVLNKES